VPSPLLLTPATTLQGGSGLGAAVTALETATGRPVIWATAQYLSFAAGTEPIDLEVTVEVAGHNTTQARCVVSRHGQEILTAHGALGRRSFGDEGVWCAMPGVPTPDECPGFRFFERGRGHMGDLVELRLAKGRQLHEIEAHGGRGDGSFALWARCWAGAHDTTAADLAFIGDFLPLGFADAMGAPYAGNSLDNTIRVGKLVPTEWVLLAVHVQQVANGFGYGRAELWAEDGTLLGEVSQSAVLRLHSRIRDAGLPPRTA
jgi:acyl-CoA thioesterase